MRPPTIPLALRDARLGQSIIVRHEQPMGGTLLTTDLAGIVVGCSAQALVFRPASWLQYFDGCWRLASYTPVEHLGDQTYAAGSKDKLLLVVPPAESEPST